MSRTFSGVQLCIYFHTECLRLCIYIRRNLKVVYRETLFVGCLIDSSELFSFLHTILGKSLIASCNRLVVKCLCSVLFHHFLSNALFSKPSQIKRIRYIVLLICPSSDISPQFLLIVFFINMMQHHFILLLVASSKLPGHPTSDRVLNKH